MHWGKLIIMLILFLYFPILPAFGWQDFYDREGSGGDVAYAVAVSPDGSKVFAAGTTYTAAGAEAFTVRAYNPSTGTVLWTQNYDREGSKGDAAYAVAVSPDGTKVFAAGTTFTTAGGWDFTVGAYNASTGAVLWERNYDREGALFDAAYAVAVSPDGSKVFAAGTTYTAAGAEAFTVRAYNASTGAVLWGRSYDRQGIGDDGANAVTVSPDGTKVFTAGFTQTATGSYAFTVRTYNSSTGVLLWGRSYDKEGSKDDKANAVAVSPDGTKVFAAGFTQTTAGGSAFTVRAYNASTGAPLWKRNYNREGSLEDKANAVAVSPDGSRVFAAGTTETAAGWTGFTVRAYNPSTGAVLWGDYYDREGFMEDYANAVAVSPDGSRVFATGTTFTLAGGGAFTVRAYNASTGAVLWTQHYDREGSLFDVANAVAVSPDSTKVFAAGTTYTTAGAEAFTVGAYNASTGTLVSP